MDVKFNKDDFIAEDKKLKIKDKIYVTNLFISSLIILGCGILNFQYGNSSLGTVFMVTGSNLLSYSFKIKKLVNNKVLQNLGTSSTIHSSLVLLN